VRARFTFDANEPATFECKLGRRFKSCSSPYRKKVGRGRHTFQVRAIDQLGAADATAEKFRWRVTRRRR
jgi:hypothetical protein